MNKKPLIILLLVLIIAALAYFMGFGLRDKEAGQPVLESNLTNQSSDINAGAMSKASDLHDHSNDGHDHAHDHGHSHDEVEAAVPNMLVDLKTPNPIAVSPLIGERGLGNPDAPVKLTEVFSLTCSHCATFHNTTYPRLKKNYIDTGKIYYVYQEFPLNAPALHASMIARCLPQERYAGFIDMLFKTQDKWLASPDYKAPLRQNAKLAGMSDADFDACMENKELQQAFAGVIQEASTKWNVKSTPTLVFNDGEKVVTGAQGYLPMSNIIEQFIARDAPKMSKASEGVMDMTARDAVNKTMDTVNDASVKVDDATQKAGSILKEKALGAMDAAKSMKKGVIEDADAALKNMSAE